MSDEIFSRRRRHLARARAIAAPADSQWLLDHMAADLIDRLSFMTLDIGRAMVIGHGANQLRVALPSGAVLDHIDLVPGPDVSLISDEDHLPVAAGSFDLILACGTLDSVDDLPGALLLIRRALRPGGLFLGALLGAGSLQSFRKAVQTAEIAAGTSHGLRFHPQIEVRAAGDLLLRAGLSTPVADQEDVRVRYSSLEILRSDLAGMGARSALRQAAPLRKAAYQELRSQFPRDGFEEQFSPIYMTGWAPVSGEKRPSGPTKARF